MNLMTVGVIIVGWAWIVAAAAAFQIVVDWMTERERAVRAQAQWLAQFVRRVR